MRCDRPFTALSNGSLLEFCKEERYREGQVQSFKSRSRPFHFKSNIILVAPSAKYGRESRTIETRKATQCTCWKAIHCAFRWHRRALWRKSRNKYCTFPVPLIKGTNVTRQSAPLRRCQKSKAMQNSKKTGVEYLGKNNSSMRKLWNVAFMASCKNVLWGSPKKELSSTIKALMLTKNVLSMDPRIQSTPILNKWPRNLRMHRARSPTAGRDTAFICFAARTPCAPRLHSRRRNS